MRAFRAAFEKRFHCAIVAMYGCQVAKMLEFGNDLTLETRIGRISVKSIICADDLVEERISLKAIEIEPRLPEGMSVQNCTAILLVVDGETEIHTLQFTLSISVAALGSPCTGQCLDAQEWSDQGKLVVIGTEDSEALLYRLPNLREENIQIVEFTPHSMGLKLKNLPTMRQLSVHFIVAENDDPEPVESSAWLAVDESHSYLLDQQ